LIKIDGRNSSEETLWWSAPAHGAIDQAPDRRPFPDRLLYFIFGSIPADYLYKPVPLLSEKNYALELLTPTF
jgi:hypothetical protein